MIEAGAKADCIDKFGRDIITTYMNVTKSKVNSDIVKMILKAGFDVRVLLPDVKAKILKEIMEVFE